MARFTIPLADIGELANPVAITGAIAAASGGDDMFEYVIGVVVILYEMYPG